MKLFSLTIVALAALASQGAVEFSNIRVQQRWPWSKKVDIRYDVTGLEAPSYVRVTVKDRGQDLDVCASSLAGDVKNVTDGTDRHIVWDPLQTVYTNRTALTDVTVELAAFDHPLYMIVDLTKKKGDAEQYRYIFEDELHAGKYGSVVTNPVAGIQSLAWTAVTNGTTYKYEKLALRYIPAGTVHDAAANVDMTLAKPCWAGVFEFTEGQYWTCFATNSTAWNTAWKLDPANIEKGAGRQQYVHLRGYGQKDGIYYPSTGRAVAPGSRLGRLRAQLGFDTIDLPTTNEWFYAARAGSTAIYSDNATFCTAGVTEANLTAADPSYTALDNLGWYVGNKESQKPANGVVGLKAPNAWGLYDVQGNQHEWGIDFAWPGDTYNRARLGGCYAVPGWRCGLTYASSILTSNNRIGPENDGTNNGFRIFILDID